MYFRCVKNASISRYDSAHTICTSRVYVTCCTLRYGLLALPQMRVWVTAGQTKFNLEEVQRSRKKGDSSLAGLGAGADIRQQKSVAVYSVCSA